MVFLSVLQTSVGDWIYFISFEIIRQLSLRLVRLLTLSFPLSPTKHPENILMLLPSEGAPWRNKKRSLSEITAKLINNESMKNTPQCPQTFGKKRTFCFYTVHFWLLKGEVSFLCIQYPDFKQNSKTLLLLDGQKDPTSNSHHSLVEPMLK